MLTTNNLLGLFNAQLLLFTAFLIFDFVCCTTNRVTHVKTKFVNDFMFVHMTRRQKYTGKLRL